MTILRLSSVLLGSCRPDAMQLLTASVCTLMGRNVRRGLPVLRTFATENNDKKQEEGPNAAGSAAGGAKASAEGYDGPTDASANGEPTTEELMAQIKLKEDHATKLTQQVETLTDSLKRTLADMENLRARTAREVDVSKKFAIQGFVKSLLDVPDNLERAAAVVPPEALKEDGNLPPEKMRNLLSGLLEGVRATESILQKVLKQHGVERYDPAGQAFDPNLHNALFDIQDPTKENNTIAIVTKKGYKLNDRVVRPAEVGVVRNVTS